MHNSMHEYAAHVLRFIKKYKCHVSPHHLIWGMKTVQLDAHFSAMRFCVNKVYQSIPQDLVKQKLIQLNLHGSIQSKISRQCMHLKGHGGRKVAAEKVQENLAHYSYIYKSDIQSFYAHIDHDLLEKELSDLVHSKSFIDLILKSVTRVIDTHGYFTPLKGIPMGHAASPLLGAVYLKRLDEAMTRKKDIFYIRYMDDFIMMAKTKSQFKSALKHLKQILAGLNLKEHPNKTLYRRLNTIGYDTVGQQKHTLDYLNTVVHSTDVGINFLGYHIARNGIRIARSTAQKMINTKTVKKKKRYYKPGSIQEEIYGPYWMPPKKRQPCKKKISQYKELSGHKESSSVRKEINCTKIRQVVKGERGGIKNFEVHSSNHKAQFKVFYIKALFWLKVMSKKNDIINITLCKRWMNMKKRQHHKYMAAIYFYLCACLSVCLLA